MYLEAGKKCQELKTTNMSKIHQMEQLSRVHDLKFKIVSFMVHEIISKLEDQNFHLSALIQL